MIKKIFYLLFISKLYLIKIKITLLKYILIWEFIVGIKINPFSSIVYKYFLYYFQLLTVKM
jgi:hypothetical protein